MAEFTNVSQRLIHAPDGTMMIPGVPCEVLDEAAENTGFQDLVNSGDIVAGVVSPEDQMKINEKREAARQEQESKAREEAPAEGIAITPSADVRRPTESPAPAPRGLPPGA